MYKSTFYRPKIGPKSRHQLIRGSKTEIQKSLGQIFCVIIAYLKENSKIKDKFFKKFLPRNKKKLIFLALKWGGGGGAWTYIRDQLKYSIQERKGESVHLR